MIENFTTTINIIPDPDTVIFLYLKVSRVTLDGGGVATPASRQVENLVRGLDSLDMLT